jgi:hypothetical protein
MAVYTPPNKLYGVPEGVHISPLTLKFNDFLMKTKSPIIAPPAVTWDTKIPDSAWGMDGNDKYGDCVLAAAAHMENIWTAWNDSGNEVVMTTTQVLQAYSEITGFKIDDPSTDNGTDPAAMLSYWQTTGMPTGEGRRKILGFVAVDHTNLNEVKLAIDWFGGVFTSWALPLSFQNATSWNLPPNLLGDNKPYSWGGHETIIGGYEGDTFKTVTWGADDTEVDPNLIMSPDYNTTMYVAISPDWFRKTSLTPCIMNMNALSWAMQEVAAR